jgi:hypothetical protein
MQRTRDRGGRPVSSKAHAIGSEDLSGRVAFAAAIAASVFGILYLLGVIVSFAQSGAGPAPRGTMRIISALVAILWNPTLLVLFVALRARVQPAKLIAAELAAVFFALVCVTSSINWFTQLTAGRQIVRGGDTSLIALVDPSDPGSIMFSMEHLGWGLFLGLGALFAAWAFAGRGLERAIRCLLAAAGVLSLLHAVGIVASVRFMRIFGYASWALFLPAATVLMARWVRAPSTRS